MHKLSVMSESCDYDKSFVFTLYKEKTRKVFPIYFLIAFYKKSRNLKVSILFFLNEKCGVLRLKTDEKQVFLVHLGLQTTNCKF